MDASRAIELLESLIEMVENLKNKYGQYDLVKEFKTLSKVRIRTIFDEKLATEFQSEITSIRFSSMVASSSHPEWDRESWQDGIKNAKAIIRSMIENVRLLDETGNFGDSGSRSDAPKEKSNRIFIVHGHDDDMKKDVALFLYQLRLDPIMLSDEANGGFKSVMEKFEKNAGEADFAIVLLSPDDVGYAKRDGDTAAKSRARQNVILELGYFIGKLGRENVLAFTKLDEKGQPIEQPSDIVGSVLERFEGNWQERIRKELTKAGYLIS